MLEITNLVTGYGKKKIIDGISIIIETKSIVALIGHNGAGKSTILKTILGILPIWEGHIIFQNKHIDSQVYKNIKQGISFLPQGNQVFDEMTVIENLEVASFIIADKVISHKRIEEVFERFPILNERSKQLAGKLSGGEQQILALGMALIQRPKLLLMDEPSLGLAPSMVKKSFEMIRELNEEFNMSILIVEQKVREVLALSDRTYILRLGKVALEGDSKEILREEKYKEIFLS